MTLYEELKARGLIAQVTNEEEISKMINEGKATFYIGFDPTADSLHVGHFMALCLMKRLQMAGNKPIALVGGGTGYIGDPSGRSDMRSMMTPETIQHNCDCFKKQMDRLIDFADGAAMAANNADWLPRPQLSSICMREVWRTPIFRQPHARLRSATSSAWKKASPSFEMRPDYAASGLRLPTSSYQHVRLRDMQIGGDDQWSQHAGRRRADPPRSWARMPACHAAPRSLLTIQRGQEDG